MTRKTKTTVILLLITQAISLTACIAVKDSDGNSVYIDGSGSKVTSPEGKRIYEYDSNSGRSTKYDSMDRSEESVYHRDEQQ